VVQTSGPVDADGSLESVLDDAGLKDLEDLLRAPVDAASHRVVRVALIETNEDVPLEADHRVLRIWWNVRGFIFR
jgi:hypothetical protein